jgi:hypothetical protein
MVSVLEILFYRIHEKTHQNDLNEAIMIALAILGLDLGSITKTGLFAQTQAGNQIPITIDVMFF